MALLLTTLVGWRCLVDSLFGWRKPIVAVVVVADCLRSCWSVGIKQIVVGRLALNKLLFGVKPLTACRWSVGVKQIVAGVVVADWSIG